MITSYVSIQPGAMEQKIFIEDDEIHSVDTIKCSLDKLANCLIAQKASRIILNGNNNFTNKIEKEIKELEITTYGKNSIEIIKGDIF